METVDWVRLTSSTPYRKQVGTTINRFGLPVERACTPTDRGGPRIERQ